jgi:cysteine synthase
MYRLGVRRFMTTARKAAETVMQMEGPNSYGIKVSTAQGIVKGLVGGEWTFQPLLYHEENSN